MFPYKAVVDQTALRTTKGLVFAVRRVVADYLAPAHFDDVLAVTTTVTSATGARIVLDQRVLRGHELLFSAEVTLVCLTAKGQPTRFPADIRTAFTKADLH